MLVGLQAQQRAAGETAYSRDNFAYGSTPYTTWRRVMQSPLVAAAVARALAAAVPSPPGWAPKTHHAATDAGERMTAGEEPDPAAAAGGQRQSGAELGCGSDDGGDEGGGGGSRGAAGSDGSCNLEAGDCVVGERASAREYVVLGSSVGWMVFFAAMTYGLESRGVELLSSLVQVARRIAEECAVLGARFECCDALRASVSGACIVLCASQCWDDALRSAVQEKLLQELSEEAVVIDYTDFMSREGDSRLEVCDIVEGPVSWNPSQRFFVLRRPPTPAS